MAVADIHFLCRGATAKRLAEDIAEIEHAHLRPGHSGDLEGRQARRGAFLHCDLDLAVVERALAQHLAEFLASLAAGIRTDQRVEYALLSGALGRRLDLLAQ